MARLSSLLTLYLLAVSLTLAFASSIQCEGSSCTASSKRDLIIQRTQDYWYSMWLKQTPLFDKVEASFTEDVELRANGGVVVKGRSLLSQAIRSNGHVLYDNYVVADFQPYASWDNSNVWVQMRRGIRNLYTNVSGLVLYVARVDFNQEGQISAVNEFPSAEESTQYIPQVVPNAKGSVEYYMCVLIETYCPTLDWGLNADGSKKTCYQNIIHYRETDADFVPRFYGASKRCVAIQLTSLSKDSASMLCPVFAKGNGSPIGCWDQ